MTSAEALQKRQARRLKPQKYLLLPACSMRCTLNPRNLPQTMPMHSWFEQGKNNEEIITLSDALGHHVSNGAVGNHRRKHLQPIYKVDEEITGKAAAAGLPAVEGVALSELEVIDRVIRQFGRQVTAGNVQVSTEQGLKAIELKLKLTQGSVFDAMFEAMRKGGDGMDELEAEIETLDEEPADAAPE